MYINNEIKQHKFEILFILFLLVTHTEVMSGLSSQDLGKKCVWLKRNIIDIEEQKPSYQLSRFIGIHEF